VVAVGGCLGRVFGNCEVVENYPAMRWTGRRETPLTLIVITVSMYLLIILYLLLGLEF